MFSVFLLVGLNSITLLQRYNLVGSNYVEWIGSGKMVGLGWRSLPSLGFLIPVLE